MHQGLRAEDLPETLRRECHLRLRPFGIRASHAVLPPDVVPRVDADLESLVAHTAQDRRAALADIRAGKHGAIEQGTQSVVRNDGRASHFLHETGTKRALDGAPGVVRSEAEEKCRARIIALEEVEEPRHAFARSTKRIDVDLERKLHPEQSWVTGKAILPRPARGKNA